MAEVHDDVAVIGAGPYGLAATAHLRAAGLATRTFGQPMGFWDTQMPAGMFLRSPWRASHIADPDSALTLDAYQAARGRAITKPIPLADFVAYGRWFQTRGAPEVDPRHVTWVEPIDGGFRLLLDDGEPLVTPRVVVATGLGQFPARPAVFDDLPSTLASHTVDHGDLSIFAGQQVAVIGAGQSALESSALMHEAGADVEIIMRAPELRWLSRSAWLHKHSGFLRPILYAPAEVGPPGMNWLIEYPHLFRRCPQALQARMVYRGTRPAIATWIRARLAEVPVTTGRSVVSATPAQGRLRLRLTDGSERLVDHVLLATGYRVDAARYPFLPAAVGRAVRGPNGYPRLGPGFESSVPGLHFLGAAATESHGPIMRFVAGTRYAGRALAAAIRHQRAPMPAVAEPLPASD